MPRYVIERLFDQTKEKLEPSVADRAVGLIEERFPEIVWEHSHIVVEDGPFVRTFCIYSAPNEEQIREHGQATANHEILNIYELAGDTTPGDVSVIAD